ARAFADFGGRAILKTRRFGYDGKGQGKPASADDAGARLAPLRAPPVPASAADGAPPFARFAAPSILESFVDFAFEASVIAARGADGGFAAYDPPQNHHEDHILRRSTVPSRLSAAQAAE